MKRRLHLLLFLLLFSILSSAQNSFNGDSLFNLARTNAFSNNHALALTQCDTVLGRYPDYTDVKILKARIYSWDKNYDGAQSILEKIIEQKPDYIDAYQAITDNALWSGNPQDAIIFAEKGILVDPNNVDLQLKKAKAQIALNNYKEAEKTIKVVKQINPDNAEAEELEKSLALSQQKNAVGLTNLHDWFGSVYTQRNLLSLEYKRKTSLGPLLGRINYANRYSTSGFQYELDFYPKINSTLSGYLNYGYSNALTLFPKHKFGAELFNNFTKKISASLGVRYMMFENNNILTLTGSGGIYTGHYWFGIRAYVTPTKQRTTESIYLFARRFLKDDKNYITLTLGQGVSPENTSNSLNFDSYYYLNSQTAKLQWVKTLGNRFSFQLGTEFTRLQLAFDTSKYIFQFTLDTGLKYQF